MYRDVVTDFFVVLVISVFTGTGVSNNLTSSNSSLSNAGAGSERNTDARGE